MASGILVFAMVDFNLLYSISSIIPSLLAIFPAVDIRSMGGGGRGKSPSRRAEKPHLFVFSIVACKTFPLPTYVDDLIISAR